MSEIPVFYCCNRFQDFKKYKHKKLDRVYHFAQCELCKRYFQFEDGEIFTGIKARETYKYYKPNLTLEKPTIKYLKSLSYGVPARKTHNVYAKDENNRVLWDIKYLKSKTNELVLDANQNPIITSKKMKIEEKLTTHYQLIKISNCGKEQTVDSTLNNIVSPVFERELSAVS